MKHYFTLLLIGFFALSAHAQKFGYINSQALLVQSPQIKAADT
jgi:Skp family chaperone for outer membrane proteins